MSAQIPAEALHLRSLVIPDRTLELFLDMVPVPEPGPDEVVIRVEAAPLNPSDMGLLFGGADMAAAGARGGAVRPCWSATRARARSWRRASLRPRRLCWARSSLRRAAECTRNTGRSTSRCA